MAKSKFFHVVHTPTGKEDIVSAPRSSFALATIAGDAKAVQSASDAQIADHYANGGSLHEKSRDEGDGKLFLIDAEPAVLIRAKNAGEAFGLINDGAYEVKPATQDALVRLLSAGLKPVYYVEQVRANAAKTTEQRTGYQASDSSSSTQSAPDDAAGVVATTDPALDAAANDGQANEAA